MIACAFRRRGCRPCLVVRFVSAGFCAALLLFALLFFAEAKVTTGASQWRALLHDGEIVLGRRRLPANDPGETSGLVEIANNPFDLRVNTEMALRRESLRGHSNLSEFDKQ